MEFLRDLANRANLGNWDSWSTQYRVLAVLVALLAAWLVVRAVVPTLLRLLRPAFLIAIVLLAIWALYPAETCAIEFLSKLPLLCAR